MKKSLKHVYKELMNELRQELSTTQINSVEEKSYRSVFDETLNKKVSTNLKVSENNIIEFNVKKENIIDAVYFIFKGNPNLFIENTKINRNLLHTKTETLSENSEEAAKTTGLAKSAERQAFVDQQRKNLYDPEDVPADDPDPPSHDDIEIQDVSKEERGIGKGIIENLVNSKSTGEFKTNLFTFLYRKVVEKKKITGNISDTAETEDFIQEVNKLVKKFNYNIITNQAGLSTTFGAFLEIIINNRIQKYMTSGEDARRGIQNSEWNYIDSELDFELASKKASIVLFLLFQKKLNNESPLYRQLTNKATLNQSDWFDMFKEAMSGVDFNNMNASIDKVINVYIKLLGYNTDKSKTVCFEYEKDTELKERGFEIPERSAPFDFIIRSQSNSRDIRFGLFDLKCTNILSPSDPITAAKTGANKSNSAIGNINKTIEAAKRLGTSSSDADKDVQFRFVGLSSIEYSIQVDKVDKESKVLSFNFEPAKHKISPAKQSVDYSKDKKDFYLSNVGNVKNQDVYDFSDDGQNNFINDINSWIVEPVDANFDKVSDAISDLRNLCSILLSTGYTGTFSNNIDESNYNQLLNCAFDNIQLVDKIKNIPLSTDGLEDKYSVCIKNIREDDSFNVMTIAKDCLYASINNSENYIKVIIDKTSDKTRTKRNIAQSLLRIFSSENINSAARRNKMINLNNLFSLINITAPNWTAGNYKDFWFGNIQYVSLGIDLNDIIKAFNDKIDSLSPYKQYYESYTTDGLGDSYVRQGKTLVEVYSYLFGLKKTINEGALGGHMMHPYEALDMTPVQIASRIKQYGVPQKIIEKVDGQNLFFTIETDGTLLFARNKEDMTHDDLVEKFTGHPAEKPFIEGGSAIKAGVESLLNSISQEEVIRLFHPSEGIRTFVNFEIMHPEKPNQIIYDEKYIVFHGIVDYRSGREEVSRSNQDQRIQELVSLMSSGVSSAGFTLASNREVDLNQLTDIQIAEYTQKIYDISEALGMEEGETLGDGIMNVIGDEIEAEGVSLSDEALTIFTDYIVRGEDSEGRSIASREWTKLLSKEDVAKLRQLGLTSTSKVKTKIGQILQPFKALFVELGIDLLKGVQSSYMSADMNIENIELIRDKLSTAISDLENYISSVPEEEWSNSIKRLIPHMELINRKGLDNIVSSAVEGGVYSANDNLFKVTGGFAPMNQIIGAAYRDNEGIFTTFKEKFMQQENNRRSLRDIFSLIF